MTEHHTSSTRERAKLMALIVAALLVMSTMIAVFPTGQASAALPTPVLTFPAPNDEQSPIAGTLTVQADITDTAGELGPVPGTRQVELWVYAEDSLGSPTTFVEQHPNNHESKIFGGYGTLIAGDDTDGTWEVSWTLPDDGVALAERDGDHTTEIPAGETRAYDMPTGYYGLQVHALDDEWLAAPGTPGYSDKVRVYFDTGLDPSDPGTGDPGQVQNADLEQWTGAEPDCWQLGGWGDQTDHSLDQVAGRNSNSAAALTIDGRVSGDRKLWQTPACGMDVEAGKKYRMSTWYTSTTPDATLTALVRDASTGTWDYWTDFGGVVEASTWVEAVAVTPAIPAGVDGIRWGIALYGDGTLTTDDYEFTEDVPVTLPPPPAGELLLNTSLEIGQDAAACYGLTGWGDITAVGGLVSDAHTGARAYSIDVTERVSGDRKLMPTASDECSGAVEVGETYVASAWYKSTVATSLTAFRHDVDDGWVYWTELDALAPAVDWTEASATTPAVPAGTDQIIFGVAIWQTGTLTTDDYSLTKWEPVVVEPPAEGELLQNTSLEDGDPDASCFTLAGWGDITATGGLVPDSHTGDRAYQIDVTERNSGDRKLLQSATAECAAAVTPGESYDASVWYKSSVPVSVTAFRHDVDDGWVYWTELEYAPTAPDWQQLTTTTPDVPTGTDQMIFGVSVWQAGMVVTDDYSLSEVPPYTPTTGDEYGEWTVASTDIEARAPHAVVLNSGEVLIIAGSGNDPAAFDAGSFETVLWDPVSGDQTQVDTPDDMFCGGHVQLPDGKVLVLSGTSNYPEADGSEYYGGAKFAYYFDPADESYHRLGDPENGMWYPTSIVLGSGNILNVGGLKEDGSGNVHVEYFDSEGLAFDNSLVAQTWRFWGLYPSMTLLEDGRLFYSGSYVFEPADVDSGAAYYDWETGEVTEVDGLRNKDNRDSSMTMLLHPAQDQRLAVVGGGDTSSATPAHGMTDMIDLKDNDPHFSAGPDLPHGSMYHTLVMLPTGQVLKTGRSLLNRVDEVNHAAIADPDLTSWTPVASDPVPRGYHSTAILLPDGRVVALGNNPGNNTWEFKVSIYSPSYMNEERPAITGPNEVGYGEEFTLTTSEPVDSARLLRPMAVTHAMDANQRSVELEVVSTTPGDLTVKVPSNPNLTPPGYYMLFGLDSDGNPSEAHWVKVG